MRVRWLPAALRDLEDIRRYITGDNPRAAAEVVRRIRAAADLLKHHSEIGRSGRLSGTRELVVAGTAYILPYRILAGRIEVLSVIHGAQEWPESL